MTIESTEIDPEGEVETPAAVVKPEPEVDKAAVEARRIKTANRTLQKERDDLKAKLDKYEADAQNAKLTETEKWAKAIKDKEAEADVLRQEAAKAKTERDFERRVSTLVAKHKLADPDYGEIVLKGYNPDEHADLDAYVAEVKKRPAIARLFESERKAEKVLDDAGNEIVPSISGSSNKTKTQGGWETSEREIAESLFPGQVDRQNNYIQTLKKLKAGK